MDWMVWAAIGIVVVAVVGAIVAAMRAGGSSGSLSGAGSDRATASGVGFTFGSDGVSPHADVGGGIGIDLKDGSTTVDIGGGMRLDTDGSGIKFKP